MAENDSPRVLALCGNMVVVFGMERMTFEVLRALRDGGAEVHCILNEWENHRIQPLAESIGASWSTGFYGYALRRTANPVRWLGYAVHVLRTSLGLLRRQRAFGFTHVLVPDFVAVLKNAPALAWLRLRGIPVVLRSSTNPDRGRFYEWLWRFAIGPLVTTIVVPSRFTLSRCADVGLAHKSRVIRNTVPERDVGSDTDREVVELARAKRTLLCIGQIAPFKGTHFAVEATLALLDRGEDVQLVVAGPKPHWPPDYVRYFESLDHEVVARGRESRVHFVGPVSNVRKLMEASYLLLAPIPGEESFCLVVLEAKCAGLPVVAFARGAVPELVEHARTGYLCRDADRESLLEGIDFFLSDERRRDRAAEASLGALGDPENGCSPEVFASSWRAVFAHSREDAAR